MKTVLYILIATLLASCNPAKKCNKQLIKLQTNCPEMFTQQPTVKAGLINMQPVPAANLTLLTNELQTVICAEPTQNLSPQAIEKIIKEQILVPYCLPDTLTINTKTATVKIWLNQLAQYQYTITEVPITVTPLKTNNYHDIIYLIAALIALCFLAYVIIKA